MAERSSAHPSISSFLFSYFSYTFSDSDSDSSSVGRMLDSVPDIEETDDAFPFFNKYIIREECLKAQLMKLSAEWDQAIRQTESNEYLNGQIYAVLEFAGITEEKEFPGDWDSEKRVSYFEKYRKYADNEVLKLCGFVEPERIVYIIINL